MPFSSVASFQKFRDTDVAVATARRRNSPMGSQGVREFKASRKRRIALRATANMLTGCLILGLVLLPPARAEAGPQDVALAMVTTGNVLAQTSGTSSPSAKPSAKDLLYQARVAMKDGKYDEAERLIGQAEKAHGPADPLVGRFEDSPEKARRALAALREGTGADPASRTPSPPASGGGQGAAPSRYSSTPDKPESGTPPARAAQQGTAKGRAFELLLAARQSLAQGKPQEATENINRVKQMQLSFAPQEDSPERVEALLKQYQRYAPGPRPGEDTATFQRQFVQFLLDQSEQLLIYGDLDTAQRTAMRAQQVPVQFGEQERSPEKVLRAIAQLRKQAESGEAVAGSELPQRLPAPLPADEGARQDQVRRLLAQSGMELDRGNLNRARSLAEEARELDVALSPSETQPWQLLMEIERLERRRGSGEVAQASYDAPGTAEAPSNDNFPVQRGVYDPRQDSSRVVAARSLQDGANGDGEQLFERGLRALEAQDREEALRWFRMAWQQESELDPETRQKLKDKLTLLGGSTSAGRPEGNSGSPLEEIATRQQVVQQQLQRDVSNEQQAARQQSQTDPKGALNRLQRLRDRVNNAEVDAAAKKHYLTLVDRSVRELEGYIEQYRSDIELEERNQRVVADFERDQEMLIKTQDQLADMVNRFNTLMEERRYEDAEIIAKQAREIAPDEPVVQNLVWKSRFARRVMADMAIKEAKEAGFVNAMLSVEEASTPYDDREPLVFGDRKAWQDLSNRRLRMLERETRRRSPEEIEIQRNLQTKVSVSFRDVPLQDVLKTLADLADVPLFIDPQGLAVEAVTSDQPVTLELSREIPLKSALMLILQPLRLGYVVENDVLKITSEGARSSKVYAVVYNVADLVIPIPNFVPGYNIGLPAAIREAHTNMAQMGIGGGMQSGVPMMLAADEVNSGPTSGSVLAQTGGFGKLDGRQRNRPNQFAGMGPGGTGGAAGADFDTLIDLVTSTIHTNEWLENGGNGTIQSFPTNLSLVISQTEEVHEDIADLLEQLRRLMDLQVTVEVRFITLNDDFFERIGIDFDFDIDDRSGLNTRTPFFPDDTGPSIVIGLDNTGNPTPDLDLRFSQDSFGAAVPQFGGFDAATAANFGFAILSDIEVFFLLQAAQGDRRSNVLQAPKVTMFDGQTASVSDQSQRPFVTSIIPVVGDFAAAQAPVITVLGEGTSLSVQAVVSHDRRFVRLTLVPFFSQIGEVRTFTYEGSTTTRSGTNIIDGEGNPVGERDNVERITSGSTVQLPTFSFTSVSTTVNVPDGGTVLLGGIKRLSEGRNERGVPMLSKLPYISRLFKNVGIGRQTQSLMMMVTPRIIIQEEEEARLGVDIAP
jgi:general secretion pathway protein D